jgi:hypothetical protein
MDAPSQWQRRLQTAILSGILLLSIALVRLQIGTRVRVTVRNSGMAPIRSVTLNATGTSCSVGDLLPGSSARKTVKPEGESHLEIEYSDSDEAPVRLSVDCYFEPGYSGTIDVSIKNRRIDEQHVDVRPRYY